MHVRASGRQCACVRVDGSVRACECKGRRVGWARRTLPQGSRGKGRSQDGPPPGTLQSSLPGDTHRADRDDRAGHPRAGPAHAEPAAKQRRDHCAALRRSAGCGRDSAAERPAQEARLRSAQSQAQHLLNPRRGNSRRRPKARRPGPLSRFSGLFSARGRGDNHRLLPTRPSLSSVSPSSVQWG